MESNIESNAGVETGRLNLVTVVGNPKAGSRTLAAATALSDAIAGLVVSRTARTIIDLADIGPGLLVPWALSTDAARAVAAVRAADLLVLATPTYKASFTGLLKLLLDTLPAGSLARTVVVPLAVSAGPAHRHLADWQLRPVLSELGAVVPVPSLLLAESDLPELSDIVGAFTRSYGRQLRAALAALAHGQG